MLCFSCKLINPCIDHLLMNYYEEKESVLVPVCNNYDVSN